MGLSYVKMQSLYLLTVWIFYNTVMKMCRKRYGFTRDSILIEKLWISVHVKLPTYFYKTGSFQPLYSW